MWQCQILRKRQFLDKYKVKGLIMVQFRPSAVTLCALAMFAGLPASAQSVDNPTSIDSAILQPDVSDLRSRLLTLIDRFDHWHSGRDAIEAIMGVTFPTDLDPAKKNDPIMAHDLYLQGYKHLDFNQYFNPVARKSIGRTVVAMPVYVGEFGTIPFDQDEARCLSLHEFRDHLVGQGWSQGDGRITTKNTSAGLAAATTQQEFNKGDVNVALTVRGIPERTKVPPFYLSKLVPTKENDCLVRVELSDLSKLVFES